MIGQVLAAVAVSAWLIGTADARDQWTVEKAQAWYSAQPWLIGSNYIPRTAINELEMWQADTFDAATIDQELGWAESLGMNTMRVFLHNLPWEEDANGFKSRIERFLSLADKHHIRPLFVLFDSCWDPNPQAGKQHPPIPGVHNSGWVQAPGASRLADATRYPQLETYVKDVVGSFAKDTRILAWDLWNEPNNEADPYPRTPDKLRLVAGLIGQVYDWAQSVDPTQPLTSAVWIGEHWDQPSALDEIEKIQVSRSDVNSFHDYNWPEVFARRANQMLSYGRPVFCTEYMARGNGSTFDGSLPIGKQLNIAMFNWGFVDGKTQTRFPWDSWKKPYTFDEPTLWFHEILHADGTPYRQAEATMIREYAAAPKGMTPQSSVCGVRTPASRKTSKW
jgi:hypothetical protein